MKKVLLIEKHVIMSLGLYSLLKEYSKDIEIVQKEQADLVHEYIRHEAFDLLIIDFTQSNMDISVITDIKSISPNIAILVSCNNSDKLMELNTLKAGGHALLPKTVSRSDFFGIMDVVSKRRVSLSSEMFQELFQNVAASHKEKDEYVSLTDREAGIARLLVQGLSVKHIATSLGVSSPSVSNHKTKIFKKLNVSNIIELSAYLAPATKE